MCDFNKLDTITKQKYHEELLKCANAFGGKNFFLQLLEAIRATKPHPLTAKNSQFRFPLGKIEWNKVIFQDKLSLLLKVRLSENENLLITKDEKSHKNVLNLVRTLKPIEFIIKPKNSKDGEGFTIHPFDVIDEKTTHLNLVFDAIFFCAIDSVKRALNYEPKE